MTRDNPVLIQPFLKINALSLSSPIRTPLIDNEIVLMNPLYKERFPKATQQVKYRFTSPDFIYQSGIYFTLNKIKVCFNPLKN